MKATDLLAASEGNRQLWLPTVSNEVVARHLEEIAGMLREQAAGVYRVRAFQQAAVTIRRLSTSVADVGRQFGSSGLMELPTIGRSIAGVVEQFLDNGTSALAERLRGDSAPERVFTTVANIGPKLAQRIHDELGIETLAELQSAAADGRLARVPGMGEKRVRAVAESLAGRFHQAPARRQPASTLVEQPAVSELLDLDCRYRQLADEDRLPRVAPRRFNPEGRRWLPIMHDTRGGRHYTALFSNTARAHELGTTHDWVVIYCDDDHGQGQWTAITSAFGELQGQRIIRGREKECAQHYEQQRKKEALLF